MFIAMTEDDPIGVENALRYSIALKGAKVPFELHVYPKGGHGYGLRRTENPLTAWPGACLARGLALHVTPLAAFARCQALAQTPCRGHRPPVRWK